MLGLSLPIKENVQVCSIHFCKEDFVGIDGYTPSKPKLKTQHEALTSLSTLQQTQVIHNAGQPGQFLLIIYTVLTYSQLPAAHSLTLGSLYVEYTAHKNTTMYFRDGSQVEG